MLPRLTYTMMSLIFSLNLAVNASAEIIYYEDFSGSFATVDSNSLVFGGSASNSGHRTLGFNQFGGQTTLTNLSAIGGTLGIASTSTNRRGVSLILDPTIFTPGAGDYRVSFDVSNYTAGSGASPAGVFLLYAASGYNIAPANNGNARVVVNASTAAGTPLSMFGSAGASINGLVDNSVNGNGSVSVDFTYDGSSAIGLLVGSNFGTSYQIDNLTVQTASVPEPNSLLLISSLGLATVAVRRRRRFRNL